MPEKLWEKRILFKGECRFFECTKRQIAFRNLFVLLKELWSSHTHKKHFKQIESGLKMNFTALCSVLLVSLPSSWPLQQTFWTPWSDGLEKWGTTGCHFLFVHAKEVRGSKPWPSLDISGRGAWHFHYLQIRYFYLQKFWEFFTLFRRERVWSIHLSCIMKHIRVFFKQPVNLKCVRQTWW